MSKGYLQIVRAEPVCKGPNILCEIEIRRTWLFFCSYKDPFDKISTNFASCCYTSLLAPKGKISSKALEILTILEACFPPFISAQLSSMQLKVRSMPSSGPIPQDNFPIGPLWMSRPLGPRSPQNFVSHFSTGSLFSLFYLQYAEVPPQQQK